MHNETTVLTPRTLRAPRTADQVVATPRPNQLGVLALAMAAVGGMLVLLQSVATPGWLLIPGGFAVALVALNLRGRNKDVASMAVIASVAGALVALVTLAFGSVA